MRRIPDNRVRYVPGPHVEYLYVGDDGLCSLESEPVGLWLMYKGMQAGVPRATLVCEYTTCDAGERRRFLLSSMQVTM